MRSQLEISWTDQSLSWTPSVSNQPDSDVTVDFWLECDGVRAADYNTTCPNGQNYGRWVSVDLRGTFSPMFRSRLWPGANTDGTFTLHGQSGMRTQ